MTACFRSSRAFAFALAAGLALAACGGAAPPAPTAAPIASVMPTALPPSPTSNVTPTPRPSSPARIRITRPRDGSTVSAKTVHVVMDLQHATITPVTSTNVSPDTGHVHLYVDNVLVSMNYGLEQDLPVAPGLYLLKAEFVAADHAPFSPRVWSNEVVFTVPR